MSMSAANRPESRSGAPPARGAASERDGFGAGGRVVGVLAEFTTEGAIKAAAAEVRDAGYRRWDTHTPYPVHGLEKAMGLRASQLPWLVLAAAFAGCLLAVWMQWWMNARDYPIMVSGKPLWSIPATIPVTFELTVLFSAFGAFLGMLALNGLPRFFHFVFLSERFRRATRDRYFISIDARDPTFSPRETAAFLRGLGASNVELVEA